MTQVDGNLPGTGRVRLSLEGGRIAAVDQLGPEDPDLPFVSPGFVDLQLNGYAGVHFSDPELSAEACEALLPELWKTGCTSFCPTLVSNTPDHLRRCLENLEAIRRRVPLFAKAAPGYHLEGPYLSAGPSAGAHRPEFMHAPDWEEFSALQQAAGGRIRLLTLAPEWPSAEAFARRAVQAGVRVALSHTDGGPEDVHRLAAAGASMSTHLGNGCPQLLDRHRAPFWAQLADDRLAAGIICDGFHLAPDMIRVIQKIKGARRCILVTDAVYVAGLPPGPYDFLGKPIELLETGQVVTADRKSMAGSTLDMARALAHFMQVTGLDPADALPAATSLPAEYLDLPGTASAIAPGQPANFVLFKFPDGALRIEQTWSHGVRVHG